MKKILLICVCCLCLCGCSNKTLNSNLKNQINESIDTNIKNNYTVNKPFNFDDLEITVSDEYEFTTVDNEFSDYHNQTTIKLPLTIKNLSDDTHSLNMFYYSIFGSQGTELSSLSAYFDDSSDFAGELRPGASYTKYFYFLYDGDGTYTIEFENWTEKINIDLQITK